MREHFMRSYSNREYGVIGNNLKAQRISRGLVPYFNYFQAYLIIQGALEPKKSELGNRGG